MALALCGASSPDDQRSSIAAWRTASQAGFAARFLDAKGLAWAAELIERWPRPATPPPLPQASTPIDPAEGVPPATATPRQPGTTPSPKAAAPAVEPRTDAAPLPGLPGGPPMPERLSPFRVVASQIEEERPMRALRQTSIAVPVIAGVLASCVPRSAAQLTVFDPANYQENLLSAARALEQINNQVRQLQNQAQMIAAHGPEPAAAGVDHRPGPAAHARRHPNPAARRRWHRPAAAGDAKRLRAACSRSRSRPRSRRDDVLRNAKSRWDEEYAALQRAALLQGQIADSIDADTRLLGDAMARSRNAAGALEVAQAGNELTGLSVKQSLALQSLLAAQHRAETLAKARDLATEDEARQRFKSFVGTGQPTPQADEDVMTSRGLRC